MLVFLWLLYYELQSCIGYALFASVQKYKENLYK